MSLNEIGLWASIISVVFENMTSGTNVPSQELSLSSRKCGIAITAESVAKTRENIVGGEIIFHFQINLPG